VYKIGQRYRHTAIKNSVYIVDAVDEKNEVVYLRDSMVAGGRPITVSFSDMKRLYKKTR
jgi:hypothetical protein